MAREPLADQGIQAPGLGHLRPSPSACGQHPVCGEDTVAANKTLEEASIISQTIKEETRCGQWLRKLKQEGLQPVMCILKHGWGDGWEQEERKWINGPWRVALTNHAAGGEG